MGRIANLLEGAEEVAPTANQAQLGKYLGLIALLACAVIFVIGILADMNIDISLLLFR